MYNHPRFVTERQEWEGSLSDYLVEHPATAMFHTMKGSSMCDVGIFEGDTVVIEKGRVPKAGDVVLAIVDDSYVIRIFDFHGNKPMLKSWNPEYASIIPNESLEIRWVAVSLMRKYH